MPMYTVLMPVDENEERGVAQAAAVSKLPRASEEVTVHLLHVYDTPETADQSPEVDVPGGRVAFERLIEAGVEVTPMSRQGDPAETILRSAEEVDADLILLGGRKRSPLGSLLFGSVSQAVTLDASRPVVITGPAQETRPPSHRCASCGEEYHTAPGVEITTCRNCGGTKVERIS